MQTIRLLRKPFWEGNLSLFALHLYTLLVGALLCFWTPIQCLLQNQWSSWLKENQLSAFLNLYSLISRVRSLLLFLRILHEAQFTYKLWTPSSVLLFIWYLEYQIWRYSSKGIAKNHQLYSLCAKQSGLIFPMLLKHRGGSMKYTDKESNITEERLNSLCQWYDYRPSTLCISVLFHMLREIRIPAMSNCHGH